MQECISEHWSLRNGVEQVIFDYYRFDTVDSKRHRQPRSPTVTSVWWKQYSWTSKMTDRNVGMIKVRCSMRNKSIKVYKNQEYQSLRETRVSNPTRYTSIKIYEKQDCQKSTRNKSVEMCKSTSSWVRPSYGPWVDQARLPTTLELMKTALRKQRQWCRDATTRESGQTSVTTHPKLQNNKTSVKRRRIRDVAYS